MIRQQVTTPGHRVATSSQIGHLVQRPDLDPRPRDVEACDSGEAGAAKAPAFLTWWRRMIVANLFVAHHSTTIARMTIMYAIFVVIDTTQLKLGLSG
jgi:hypothetical protein